MTERPILQLDAGLMHSRRDAVVMLALGFAGVGALAAMWPLVDQMNPNRASPLDSVEVDLDSFDSARIKQVSWNREPFFICRRTAEEIALARVVDLGQLIDPLARVAGLDAKAVASDDNRTKEGHREWLVVGGACTRCGCLVKDVRGLGFDAIEAFFCACCASRFDLSGRVRAGPAPFNLPVPPYRFIAAAKVEIGAASGVG